MTDVATLPLSAFGVVAGPDDDFSCDERTRVRGDDWGTVEEYAEAMKEGAAFPPVVAFRDDEGYWLADGFHRLAAAWFVGRETIEADVRPGGMRDAILFAVGANADHGQRRDGDAKERAVTLLLNDDEWGTWSDREIARRCKVSPTLVGKVRASLSTVDSESAERTYTTKHGTQATMKTERIGAAKAAPEPVAPTEPMTVAPVASGHSDKPAAVRLASGKTVGRVVGYLHPIAAEKLAYVNGLLARSIEEAGEAAFVERVRGHAKTRANLAAAVADARAFVARVEALGLAGGEGDR